MTVETLSKEAQQESHIQLLLAKIDKERLNVNSLLRRLVLAIRRLDYQMKSLAGHDLNSEQVMAYRDFSRLYERQRAALLSDLELFNTALKANGLQRAIMKSDIDYAFIYRRLQEINGLQARLLGTLREVTSKAESAISKIDIKSDDLP